MRGGWTAGAAGWMCRQSARLRGTPGLEAERGASSQGLGCEWALTLNWLPAQADSPGQCWPLACPQGRCCSHALALHDIRLMSQLPEASAYLLLTPCQVHNGDRINWCGRCCRHSPTLHDARWGSCTSVQISIQGIPLLRVLVNSLLLLTWCTSGYARCMKACR